MHLKSSSLHVAPPSGRKVSFGCIGAHHHQYYLEYDGNWCILRQRVVSQVKSALFNDHVSSAFLLMSRAGIKDKIKNLPFKTSVQLLLTENGLKSVWDMIRPFIDYDVYLKICNTVSNKLHCSFFNPFLKLHQVYTFSKGDFTVPGNWGSYCSLPVLLHNDSIFWQLFLDQNDFLLTFHNKITPWRDYFTKERCI